MYLSASLGSEIDSVGAGGETHVIRLSEALCKARETDAADADAICEAVTRPTMRFLARAAKSGKLGEYGGGLENSVPTRGATLDFFHHARDSGQRRADGDR